jgi:hypothetical protein
VMYNKKSRFRSEAALFIVFTYRVNYAVTKSVCTGSGAKSTVCR